MSRFNVRVMLLTGTIAASLVSCASEPSVQYEEYECSMGGVISNNAGSYPVEEAKVTQTIRTEGTDPRNLKIDTGYVFAAVLPSDGVDRTLTLIVPFDRDDIVIRMEDGRVEPVIERADLVDASSLGESLEYTGEWNFPESGGIGNIEGKAIVSNTEVMTLDLFMACMHQW